MKKRDTKTLILVLLGVAILATCLATLYGCGTEEPRSDPAADNRSYMSQANTAAIQLNDDLAPFTQAVADGDVVTMEQAASKVYRDIDAFKAIKAPDAMKDIHAEYSAGCDDLEEALKSYISVYQDADGKSADELNREVAKVQDTYDSGIAHLQAADKMVTELNGALPSSSSGAGASASASASVVASSASSSSSN